MHNDTVLQGTFVAIQFCGSQLFGLQLFIGLLLTGSYTGEDVHVQFYRAQLLKLTYTRRSCVVVNAQFSME